MIPITRKELYLNKIVGNNNYETPEKPITEEEFFFAEILGEAVQAPEPLTRYQIYLAKIAGRNIEIPYPETRLEYFLARAAGMDVETPTPITREEIFWSNYSAIVEVEGVPPLTYKVIEGTLENYRIYGNTVDGESVGDKTANLYDKDTMVNGITDAYINSDGTIIYSQSWIVTPYIPCNSNVITLTFDISIGNYPSICLYDENKNYITGTAYRGSRTITVTTEYVAKYIRFSYTSYTDLSKIMLNSGSTPLPCEPYGYKVPMTVSNGTDTLTTPIYLPEQIRKVGDEAEYIDYAEQKMHRIGAEDIDVNLPELPTLTGTNVLTVGTAVQPSKVYIKGQKEREYS